MRQSTAYIIANMLRAAAVQIEGAIDEQERVGVVPKEFMDFVCLETCLRTVSKMLKQGKHADAAAAFRDFSVVPHASWLASRPRGRRREGALSERNPRVSQSNGRLRRGNVDDWLPSELLEEEFAEIGWHAAQAHALLREIQWSHKVGTPNRSLDCLIRHRISVRIEREAAKLMQPGGYFASVRNLLPALWQPRSYYVRTAQGTATRLRHLRAQIKKSIGTEITFFIKTDKHDGKVVSEHGPFAKLRHLKLPPECLAECEIFVRREDEAEWLRLKSPKFRSRKPRRAAAEAEYEAICRKETDGANSWEARHFAWIAFGTLPPTEWLAQLERRFGRNDPKVRAFRTRRSGTPKLEQLGEVTSDQIIDGRSERDFRDGIRF